MKKLIFKNLTKDITSFFIVTTLSMTMIVWVIQAVNLLDFITEDGHSFRIYFMYTLLSLPKIFSRILPFMFFLSLFYIIIKYEEKNELIIFWLNGVNKTYFLRKILNYSLLFLITQLLFTSYFVPKTQDLARSYIRSSTMEFFPNLIKEKIFIDTIKNLTIYIERKKDDGELINIFLEDNISVDEKKTIYAKSGRLITIQDEQYLILYSGKIIKHEKKQKVFHFDETQINLSNYSSKTTTFPKIQELKTTMLLTCLKILANNQSRLLGDGILNCNPNNSSAIIEETFRRLYLPLYLPVLALIINFLILTSKDKFNYSRYKLVVFSLSSLVLVVSELSLRYSGISLKENIIFMILPIFLFLIIFTVFKKKLKYI